MPPPLSRPLLALAAVAVMTLAACGGAGTDADSAATDGAAEDRACDYPEAGSPAVDGIEPPPAEPTVTGEVEVTLSTSVGDFGLTLDAEGAPCTVNSFVSLVEQDYFDDTTCHRLTDYPASGDQEGLKVLQCGDPTGTGTGGPGYTIPDELTGEETYPAGTLAMARTSMPNSGGSQFFIVYGDSSLPPEYTVFGTVDDATVQAVSDVAAEGSTPPTDGAPNTEVRITDATVSP